MTAVDYRPFVERMISRYEGGYGWDRNDPGGPTNRGITCYDLAEHRHQKMNSMQRWAPIVRSMTLSEADDIYAQKYATACCFYELGPGVDCVVFDYGVNSGSSRSIKESQRLVGVTADGILGPMTLAAINAYEPKDFIVSMRTKRLEFLHNLSIWRTFGRGWTTRVNDLTNYSLELLKPAKLMSGPQRKLTRIPMAFAKGWESTP